jgi:hypothetical protein
MDEIRPTLVDSGVLDRIGEENVLGSFRDAVAWAWELGRGRDEVTGT